MKNDRLSSEDLVAELNLLREKNELLERELLKSKGLLKTYKDQAEKYHNIFSGSLDVIMITDGINGEIIDINDACKIVFGYQPSELTGRHYSVLIPAINENSEPIALENINMFGPVLSSRLVRKSDGSLSPMDLTINIINLDGHKAVQTCFRDAAERKKAEEGTRKYLEKLHELNTSKDKFFSVLAHDLRSPFTGLLGLSQMLIEDVDEMSKDEMVHYLSEINITIKSVYQLLNNLLSWSWVNSGQIQFSPETFNPDNKICDVIQLLKMNAAFKNIEVNFSTDGDKLLNADLNMFKSIIQNLISNAIKFTPEGGSITVSTKKSENDLIIKISDTGVGIPEENIRRIFSNEEMFSTRGTQNERGSGLGLALCKELVKRNNGEISLESKVNIGTIFTLVFPLN